MTRNGLPLRQEALVAQKDQAQLIDKLVSFVLERHHLSIKYQYNTSHIISYGRNSC